MCIHGNRLLAQNVRHKREQDALLFFCHPFFSDLLCRYLTAFCSVFKLLWITNIILRCLKICIKQKTWICLHNKRIWNQIYLAIAVRHASLHRRDFLHKRDVNIKQGAWKKYAHTCINKIVLTTSDILFLWI